MSTKLLCIVLASLAVSLANLACNSAAALLPATETATLEPTATSTTTPTITPSPTITPTPTATPIPDLSKVVFRPTDFPSEFVSFPRDDIDTIAESFTFMSGPVASAYYDPATGESIMSIAGFLISESDQTDFDQMLAYPETIAATYLTSSYTTDVSQMPANLNGLSDVGDIANAGAATGMAQDQRWSVQVVVFQREDLGVMVYYDYPEPPVSGVSVPDLAHVLDTRAVEVVGGTVKARPSATLEVTNNTRSEICFLHVSMSTSSDWGTNRLGPDATLTVGSSYTIYELTPGLYDLLAGDCSGNEIQAEYEVNLERIQTWEVTGD